MTSTLSTRLRAGTQQAHRMAEQTLFICTFLSGQITRATYRDYLVQLLHIYTALEQQQARHRSHPLLAKIDNPVLWRREALLQDLRYYTPSGDWRDFTPKPATLAYVQRIESLSQDWAEGLIAHHYTRYLGDLSGGQSLKRIVASTFKLTGADGQAFYKFAGIPDQTQFKEDYRRKLDSLPLDEAAIERLVEEANQAFALNRAVFDELTPESAQTADFSQGYSAAPADTLTRRAL